MTAPGQVMMCLVLRYAVLQAEIQLLNDESSPLLKLYCRLLSPYEMSHKSYTTILKVARPTWIKYHKCVHNK